MRPLMLPVFLSLAIANLGAPAGAAPSHRPRPAPGKGEAVAERYVYFGTHGQKPGEGIFGARFDERTGTLVSLGEVAAVFRPTWLASDPRRKGLFAVSEAGNDGKSDGQVLSFAIGPDGKLARLGVQDSGGGGPTNLDFEPRSGSLAVANYGTGSAGVFHVDAGGNLGPVGSLAKDFGTGPSPRQTSPHAHAVTFDPSGRYLLVPDLGADRTFVYRFDSATRTLAAAPRPYAQVAPGTGPRHIVFGSNGRFAYLATELTAQVIAYRWDAATGGLDPVQTIDLLPPDFQGQRSAAEIAVSRDGRFLYVSSREGENAIYVFSVDRAHGTLTRVQRFETGKRPWSFGLSPGGRWVLVAQEAENRVVVLRRDPATGRLTATGQGMDVFQPVNVTFAR